MFLEKKSVVANACKLSTSSELLESVIEFRATEEISNLNKCSIIQFNFIFSIYTVIQQANHEISTSKDGKK
jgi:hypothetical protein